jgi:hypothetical protein
MDSSSPSSGLMTSALAVSALGLLYLAATRRASRPKAKVAAAKPAITIQGLAATATTPATTTGSAAPSGATAAVLVPGNEVPSTPIVQGYEFELGRPVDWDSLLARYATTGYQGSHLGQAIEEIQRMRTWRLSHEPLLEDDDIPDPAERAEKRCKIFLGYTSNLISSGLRETFCFLAKHRLVDVIVSSAGGIEEDFIKCLAPTYMGEFGLRGAELRAKGLNRIGNLLVYARPPARAPNAHPQTGPTATTASSRTGSTPSWTRCSRSRTSSK